MSSRDIDWPEDVPLFHGGRPNLEVGDQLLDPQRHRRALPPRVWLTPERDLARRFAALWPLKSNYRDSTLGDLYAVVPDSAVRSHKNGREYTARSATIVAVLERACEPIPWVDEEQRPALSRPHLPPIAPRPPARVPYFHGPDRC